jgi:hypothetical protein
MRKKAKTQTGKNKIKTPLTRPASLEMTPATMGASEENPLSALLIYGYELSRNNSFA